ncbi:MAG TPA: AbrB/MazE/SpoVT family DNA-binding domain-containing protein [Polyangiaceae bacterium]
MKTTARIRSEVRGKGQITIPAALRKAAHIDEGDLIELEVTADGILMRPLKAIDARQAWFWTPEWQAGEREASKDIQEKRTTRHKSGRGFLSSLKK